MKPVILGAGLAGLTTALSLSPIPVTLVSPRTLGTGCSSAWAQGGIAAALGPDDNPELHATDTLAAGKGLNDPAIVRQTTQDAAMIIERLTAAGVAFDRDAHGQLLMTLEAAHQKRRIVHAKDATGMAVMQALIKTVRATPSIAIIENATAQNLIIDEGVRGVVLNQNEKVLTLESTCAVLATGGAAALWRDTTNPHENWGGGLALVARAGATLGDLEFMQFHPTAIDIGRDPMPLASESLRGEGAILIDESGQRFTEELNPRDIVTRAIWNHIAQNHSVFLDARQAIGDTFKACFPTIHDICTSAGIDPARTPIPVRPAAHYHMGGVLTNAQGRTDIAGLWACGEVACTGLHGANRLASNSLLEAASFGWRVAEDIKNASSFRGASLGASGAGGKGVSVPGSRQGAHPGMKDRDKIRAIMSDQVGVIRTRESLQRAVTFLSPLAKHSDMALVGLTIAHSALKREESRGAHYRSDFTNISDTALRSTFRLTDWKV